MEIHKPIKLGLVTRAFENEGTHYLVLSVLAGFEFDAPEQLLEEAKIWQTAQRQLAPETFLDEWMWKLRGEALASGAAYAPGGKPITESSVRLAVGSIDKRLYVVGDRHFAGRSISKAKPFTEMALSWHNAFGGHGCAENPVGKGFAPVAGPAGPVHLLPNVEHPKRLVASAADRPRPASFEGLNPAWPERQKKRGTYDAAWLASRHPDYPADIDWGCFNAAPADQQLAEGYFRGDERYRLEGMHPDEPHLEGELPQVVARAFVRRREASEIEEASSRIDTLRFFPAEKRGLMIFRAVVSVADEDASDVDQLLCAFDARAEPRPLSHFSACLARRLDPVKGAINSLRESELLPPGCAPTIHFEPSGDEREGLLEDNLRRRAQAELDRAREQLPAFDVDPDAHLPKTVPDKAPMPTDLDAIADKLEAADRERDRVQALAAERRAEAEAQARKVCREQGVDYDAMVAAAQAQQGGPPAFSAAAELDKLREQQQLALNAGVPLELVEAKLADPRLADKLLQAERAMQDAYKRFAHLMPAAAAPADERAQQLARELRIALEVRQSVSGRDFTGVDLSGESFVGANLGGALLEGALLAGVNLRGADLRGAVLARADLRGADLSGAQLRGANLGSATLDAATLGAADLVGATVDGASLRDVDLRGASLDGLDLGSCHLGGADLRGAQARETTWIRINQEGLRLQDADLSKATFVEASLPAIDLRGARLTGATFVDCSLDGGRLQGVDGREVSFVLGCSLSGADLTGAELGGSCFMTASLDEASFRDSALDGANFGKASLRKADLRGASAREASFVGADLEGADLEGANLMMAVLQRSQVAGTSFRRSNLFRADLVGAHGDDATSFDKAHIKFLRSRGPR